MFGGSEPFAEAVIRDREAALRAMLAGRVARRAMHGPALPVRVWLGLALIRGGRWLLRLGPSWAVERRRLV